jgi:ABC-type siderophore export system fused ATPase/permease subunit
MLKYGFQLTIVELCTIFAIYMVRLIIDYLHDQKEPYYHYHFVLFLGFNLSRSISILVRNYYDLHVYNFFRYVQTAIQAWIFEDVADLHLWVKIGDQKNIEKIREAEAQIINILTKDIEVFTSGSWCFPYLIVVPVNTIVSAVILGKMYGSVVILCYLTMLALLALQYVSNKKLATLQYQNC